MAAAVSELAGDGPEVGVVIPVYRQGALLPEALESVLAQRGVDLQVVVVDDGCPDPETREIGLAYAAAHPNVTYLRRANGGLSAARNAGVRWLLSTAPELPAIYLLDADNRLRPAALARARDALAAAPEHVGWIYPDIDMFGLQANWDYGGAYSPIAHRLTNVSEAGSLVRADVFRRGVFFDEGMRQGYEDWDFFLAAAGDGWVGQWLPGFGLQYRKRGESMLTQATRDDDELRSHIRRKRPKAFSLQTLLRLEQAEAPRYAIYVADEGRFAFTTDPSRLDTSVSAAEFVRAYWRNRAAPAHSHFPPYVVIASRAALDAVVESRSMHSCFARLEKSADRTAFAFLDIRRAAGAFSLSEVEAGATAGRHAQCPMVMVAARILTEAIEDPWSAWVDSLAGESPAPAVEVLELRTPWLAQSALLPTVSRLAAHLVGLLRRSPWRDGAALPVTWKGAGAPERLTAYLTLRRQTGSPKAVVTPYVRQGGRHVGFLLPFLTFGGVEKVALETARTLRAEGFTPHLILWGAAPLSWTPSMIEPFETVHVVDGSEGASWDGARSFLGTPMPWAASAVESHAEALGALAWLDAVINCHSVGGHTVMSQLRRLGVRTLAHFHVIDQTASGRPTGHPMLAIAYEHAYDHVITCSDGLGDWLSGMGVPEAKILRAPNAPGYPLDAIEVETVLAARRRRDGGGPLRALFLGRLDRQKGLERLAGVVERTSSVRWRVVGDVVLDASDVAERLVAAGVEPEPPARTPEELTELYAWADVLVLLSHWEGLPLTVLEAQRLGCVPVVTDVGAVSEAVTDGVDGLLIKVGPDLVRQTVKTLDALQGDRGRLRRLSEAAGERGRGRSWRRSLSGVIAALHGSGRTTG